MPGIEDKVKVVEVFGQIKNNVDQNRDKDCYQITKVVTINAIPNTNNIAK